MFGKFAPGKNSFLKVPRLICGHLPPPLDTDSQSIGGTGVSPVHLQAELCAYIKLPIDCNSV
jgi:hypothetical protein